MAQLSIIDGAQGIVLVANGYRVSLDHTCSRLLSQLGLFFVPVEQLQLLDEDVVTVTNTRVFVAERHCQLVRVDIDQCEVLSTSIDAPHNDDESE